MSSITERKGSIGTVRGSGESEVFQPKANFCLTIVAKVEGTKDGYLARVIRAPDNVTRDCYFCAASAMHKNEFVQAINSGFNCGGMFCTLSDVDLGNYLLKKVMEFMSASNPHTLKAVRNIGQQTTNPPVFVLSPELHINEEGYNIYSQNQQIYFDSQNIEPRLIPDIFTPYRHSLQPLRTLWNALQTCSQHNSGSALITFGAVAMNLHFQTLVELKGGAPVVVLYGEPDVGKTTIANAAMSVLGIEACSFRGTRREFFVHLASQTSLGLMYDDPNKIQEVENIIVDFYNGMTRGSFKRGLETPKCGFLLACNFSLGKIQRLLSRVVIIPFKGPSIQARTPEQRTAFSALKELKGEASLSIGFFIALGKKYREEGVFEVDTYEHKLMKMLPNCGGRTVKGYANLIWFTEKVAELVEVPKETVWQIVSKFSGQLDKLQQKGEAIGEMPDDLEVCERYWKNVAENLIALSKKMQTSHQVRSFLQLGKNAGKDSVGIAVDVAADLMSKKGITVKFTIQDLRDNINKYNCGARAQCRRFNKLDGKLEWNGLTVALKVPVVQLQIFPGDVGMLLAKCICPNYTNSSPGPVIAADISFTDDTSFSTDASGVSTPNRDDTSRNIHDTSASDSDVSSLIIGDIPSGTSTGIAITSGASTSDTAIASTSGHVTATNIASTSGTVSRKRMRPSQVNSNYIVRRRRKNAYHD